MALTSSMKYGLSQLNSFRNVTDGHNLPYYTSSEEHMKHLQILTASNHMILTYANLYMKYMCKWGI
jgi:hypothetical protein